MAKLGDQRLIYVGETHTAFADHLLQLEVLRSMAARPGELSVGVEWFQRPFQPVLDDYLAGKIEEAEMLRRTEYYQRWRFDYRLYRPIVRFAKEKGIRIIALNASRELTNEIRQVGIEALADGSRADLPQSYDFSDTEYERVLRETFKSHPTGNGDFRRFLEVQLTWDESMAEGIADYLQADPNHRILVLAGRGHIASRRGIPNRVTRRTGLRGTTIATFTPSNDSFNAIDYLVLANERSLLPAGLMRVLLDEREGGLFITGFAGGSPAYQAGVKEGDRIVRINGESIERFADLKIAMLDLVPGTEIELGVMRGGLFGREQPVELRFRLSGRGGVMPH